MTLLPAAQRVAVPWKNGGGQTQEIAVHPPGSSFDDFGWRVSIAQVQRGGPFSEFPGVDRQLGVLAGRMQLAISGRELLTLAPDSAPVRFPGDVPVAGEPLDGCVTDLNVMTRRGRYDANLARRLWKGTISLVLGADTTFIVAMSPLTLAMGTASFALAALDAVRLESVAGITLCGLAGSPDEPGHCCVAEISAATTASISGSGATQCADPAPAK